MSDTGAQVEVRMALCRLCLEPSPVVEKAFDIVKINCPTHGEVVGDEPASEPDASRETPARRVPTSVCTICDELFDATRSDARFCSASCRQRSSREARATQLPMVACQQCGAGFTATRSDARFCSAACRQSNHRVLRKMSQLEGSMGTDTANRLSVTSGNQKRSDTNGSQATNFGYP